MERRYHSYFRYSRASGSSHELIPVTDGETSPTSFASPPNCTKKTLLEKTEWHCGHPHHTHTVTITINPCYYCLCLSFERRDSFLLVLFQLVSALGALFYWREHTHIPVHITPLLGQNMVRLQSSLVLLWLLGTFSSVVATSNEEGLECASATGTKNGKDTVIIPKEWINDGYCDCPLDGLDEPNTDACSGSSSWPGVLPMNKDASSS